MTLLPSFYLDLSLSGLLLGVFLYSLGCNLILWTQLCSLSRLLSYFAH